MKSNLFFILTAVTLLFFQKVSSGQVPNLRSSTRFATFTSAGAITNSGQTTVTGDLGNFAGAYSETSLPTVNGESHIGDSVAAEAASDLEGAYNQLIATTCGSTILLTTLGSGQIITPGVYCLGAVTTINGELILDAQGDPNATFIFLIKGALATTTGSIITLINGASKCNIFFGVTGAVSLGAGSTFNGTILGHGAISLAAGASLYGRALTCAGAIELNNNTVTNTCGDCPAIVAPAADVTQPTDAVATGTIAVTSGISGLTFNLSKTDSLFYRNTTGVFSKLTPGTYNLRSQNEAGCISANLLVIIKEQPAAPVDVKDSIVSTFPTVSITKPSNNVTYLAGGNVYFTAVASDGDGTINKVAFYNGTTLIHTEYATPYGYLWKNVPVGSYTLTVKATDNSGLVSTSTAVYITVIENKAPTVSIIYPVDNQTFTGPATINLSAVAEDSDGTVSKVTFYNGTTLLRTETESPYKFIWKNVPVGNYALTAKATDNRGSVTISATANISVVSNIAPTVSIINPADSQIFTGPVTIRLSAAAKDLDGTISKVGFYNGAALLHTETESPYTFTWKNLPVGNYSLTAKATDNRGSITTSAVVNISVVPNIAPVVSIINPANAGGFTAGATISLLAAAKDSNGSIKSVKFYNGAALLSTQVASPYTYKWVNVAAGTYTITAKATDDLGLSTISAPVFIIVPAPVLVSNRPSSESRKTLDDALSVSTFPNPAIAIINIQTKGLQPNTKATISVISVSGFVLKKMQIDNPTQSIQLAVSSLPKGMYTIKIISGKKALLNQFVKL